MPGRILQAAARRSSRARAGALVGQRACFAGMATDRRGTALLAAGALAGLALAAVQLVWRPGPATALSPDVVATVNGVAISRADFEQALSGVASDRRSGLRAGDAERVLARLVDE